MKLFYSEWLATLAWMLWCAKVQDFRLGFETEIIKNIKMINTYSKINYFLQSDTWLYFNPIFGQKSIRYSAISG